MEEKQKINITLKSGVTKTVDVPKENARAALEALSVAMRASSIIEFGDNILLDGGDISMVELI